MMTKRLWILCAGIVAVAVACSDGSRSPVSPSTGSAAGGGPASADGATIKLTPPVLVSPANGATTEEVGAPLVIQAATGKFVQVQGVVHRFEVSTTGGTVVASAVVNGTTYSPTTLEPNTNYQWRAR